MDSIVAVSHRLLFWFVFCFKLYVLKSPCCSYPDWLEELCFSNNLLLQYAP